MTKSIIIGLAFVFINVISGNLNAQPNEWTIEGVNFTVKATQTSGTPYKVRYEMVNPDNTSGPSCTGTNCQFFGSYAVVQNQTAGTPYVVDSTVFGIGSNGKISALARMSTATGWPRISGGIATFPTIGKSTRVVDLRPRR